MFLIHPSELQRRRVRCKPVVEDLTKLEREFTQRCNVCGAKENVIIAYRDRYGFSIRTAMCLNCGLVYVLDRFTLKSYSVFYSKGSYRELISKFKAQRQTIERIRAAQAGYSNILIRAMKDYIKVERSAQLLDIGGSTGLIASEFVTQFGFNATVLDPASGEIAATRSLGLNTVLSTIEDWSTAKKFDLILLCRTLEHLYDLGSAFAKIRLLLKPDGLFYCDIADFVEVCRKEGPPEATTKIDHCYWLTQETAVRFFDSVGFQIVAIHTVLPSDQVGFLLRAAEPSKLKPVSRDWIEQQTRRLREIDGEWRESGRKPLDALDWVRQRAYQVKKRVLTRMKDGNSLPYSGTRKL